MVESEGWGKGEGRHEVMGGRTLTMSNLQPVRGAAPGGRWSQNDTACVLGQSKD